MYGVVVAVVVGVVVVVVDIVVVVVVVVVVAEGIFEVWKGKIKLHGTDWSLLHYPCMWYSRVYTRILPVSVVLFCGTVTVWIGSVVVAVLVVVVTIASMIGVEIVGDVRRLKLKRIKFLFISCRVQN